MAMSETYMAIEPPREDIDALPGAAVLEFGAPWCGYCMRAQAPIASAFSRHQQVRHIKVEDGSGRPLGRSFRIKLWPTLVFLRDGKEVARLVRPTDADEIEKAMRQIDRNAGDEAAAA
ncbi:Thioredoxin [Cupriavidus sp. H18C1]|jgi:Thiol-disulfide isomerase and thioredoxins|uniref:thioredoxin family protein n=1 Tax=Cupriavidus TaxID=106589 RepID=UPI001CF1AC21|nr:MULTISPECIES: thioredoxin family protein [Cupriavidus]MCA7083005.1 thioredoxin family protein [Cupriavidus sp. DB3]UZN51035.1 thioredoxin family protein [Cupriavidus cauae]